MGDLTAITMVALPHRTRVGYGPTAPQAAHHQPEYGPNARPRLPIRVRRTLVGERRALSRDGLCATSRHLRPPGRAGAQVGVRSLAEVAYEHILVAYDGTSEGDAALLTASKLAARDGARLTIVTVVALERTVRGVRRLPMLTSVWNDVLLDRARADLERAERLLDMPAERTVLFGPQTKALAAGAEEFGCDAIMLPAPQQEDRSASTGAVSSRPATTSASTTTGACSAAVSRHARSRLPLAVALRASRGHWRHNDRRRQRRRSFPSRATARRASRRSLWLLAGGILIRAAPGARSRSAAPAETRDAGLVWSP